MPIRPLRADARRNRQRVLEAARDVFAEQGLDAQMDEIASRAGVGVGTVYRHFPTKQALIDALVGDRFRELREEADSWLDVEDPWEALSGYLWSCARMQCGNRGWAQLAAAATFGEGEADEERNALIEVTDRFLKRGHKAGVVRKDVQADDIGMLMCGTCSVIETTCGHAGDKRWERFFQLALHGLRATASK
jgi:AcrR family transcriptional regulator